MFRIALAICVAVSWQLTSLIGFAYAGASESSAFQLDFVWIGENKTEKNKRGFPFLRDVAYEPRTGNFSLVMQGGKTLGFIASRGASKSKLLILEPAFKNTSTSVWTTAFSGDGTAYFGGRNYQKHIRDNLAFKHRKHFDFFVSEIAHGRKTLWELTFGEGGIDRVFRLSPATVDSLFVAGEKQGELTMLAKVKPKSSFFDGSRVLWRKDVGIGNGADMVAINQNRIALVAIEKTEVWTPDQKRRIEYGEHVVLWHFSEDGNIIEKISVRPNLSNKSGHLLNNVAVAATENATYVASSKMDWPKPTPVSVSMISGGRVVWTKDLPETVSSHGINVCKPAITISKTGDLLLACAIGKGLEIYKFDRDSGGINKIRANMPGCHPKGFPSWLRLISWGGDQVVIAGSRGESSVADGCAWVAFFDDPSTR